MTFEDELSSLSSSPAEHQLQCSREAEQRQQCAAGNRVEASSAVQQPQQLQLWRCVLYCPVFLCVWECYDEHLDSQVVLSRVLLMASALCAVLFGRSPQQLSLTQRLSL